MRGLAIGLLFLAWAPAALFALTPAPADAAGARAPQSVRAEAAKAQAAYDNALRNPDVRRMMDDRLSAKQREIDRLRQECDDARARLTQANGRGRRDQAEIGRLTREVERLTLALAEAQAWFVDELARRDRTLAAEIALYRGSLDRILETPEGLEALERINAGDIEGGRRILDSLNEARAAARRAAYDKRRNIEDAADLRATATVLLGRERISVSIITLERVVQLDPNVHRDWVELARLYLLANNLDKAEQAAFRAARTASGPRDEMVALVTLGDIQWLREDSHARVRAKAYYQQALAISEALARAAPLNVLAQHDLSVSYEKLGDVYLQAPNGRSKALDFYSKSLAIRERLVKEFPRSARLWRDLAVGYNKIGNVYRDHPGGLGTAAEYYRKGLAAAELLARDDPGSSLAKRDLAFSYEKLGDVYFAQSGRQAEALEYYSKSLSIREAVAREDPANSEALRDLSVGYGKLGDVYMSPGYDRTKALNLYEKSLSLAEVVAGRSSPNREAQRDLLVTYNRLGDAYAIRPDGQIRALELYGKGLVIAERLARIDAGDIRAQQDLALSYEKMGNAYRGQPDGQKKAADLYRKSLSIREALAKADPHNPEVQRDLWLIYRRMAILGAPGHSWQRVVDQLEFMQSRGLLDPADRRYLDEARRLRDAEAREKAAPR